MTDYTTRFLARNGRQIDGDRRLPACQQRRHTVGHGARPARRSVRDPANHCSPAWPTAGSKITRIRLPIPDTLVPVSPARGRINFRHKDEHSSGAPRAYPFAVVDTSGPFAATFPDSILRWRHANPCVIIADFHRPCVRPYPQPEEALPALHAAIPVASAHRYRRAKGNGRRRQLSRRPK